jgi:hypothetical protein
MGYRRILNVINIRQAICLPGDGNNPSFAEVQFHAVSGTPSLYMFDISLQKSAITGRTDCMNNFDIFRK